MSLPKSMDSLYRISFDNIWNDRIKITMDTNAQKVVDAIDALQVEVKLDSVKVDMPKDSLTDSIYKAVRPYGDGILWFWRLWTLEGFSLFDSTVDTFEKDSSFR